ncbi:hypothetical protein M2262_003290 [Pseudomonas sp. BIGb0408]|uniref:Uncharacterized protein n=1 Tax=Phytopseudomonas flavescens TaxID=29435 RepID=A0A7Y9XLK3_9GAMM|nr:MULTISPECIES: hypothetical protein [Pseudomonas]MCW2293240.1 hypothetical protein [Pseudomonas sp. BIGb0408]NYH72189.1 hypothetical protein [Pseudomonas flavescens]
MVLTKYFSTNDGSLPEIEANYPTTTLAAKAFELLYECGAQNATIDGGYLWMRATQSEKPFSGAADALLVASEQADPFHVVLGGIRVTGQEIPDLGVWVSAEGLVLDYRMGPEWGQAEIESFLELLRQLRDLGGVISATWWGEDGERDFLAALRRR